MPLLTPSLLFTASYGRGWTVVVHTSIGFGASLCPRVRSQGSFWKTSLQPALYQSSISLLPTLCPLNLLLLLLPEGFRNSLNALLWFTLVPSLVLSGKCFGSTKALQESFVPCASPSFGLFWVQMALLFLRLDIWTPPAELYQGASCEGVYLGSFCWGVSRNLPAQAVGGTVQPPTGLQQACTSSVCPAIPAREAD